MILWLYQPRAPGIVITTSMLLVWWMLGGSSMKWVVELFIYILDGWQKCGRPRLPSQSCYHKSNITFPNITFIYIATLAILSKRLLDALTCSFRLCSFNTCLFILASFHPFRNTDADIISFAQSGIFSNVAFQCQIYVQLHTTQLLRHRVSLLYTLFCWLFRQGRWHSWSLKIGHCCQ